MDCFAQTAHNEAPNVKNHGKLRCFFHFYFSIQYDVKITRKITIYCDQTKTRLFAATMLELLFYLTEGN